MSLRILAATICTSSTRGMDSASTMICDFSNLATVSLARITALMRSEKRLNSTGIACSAMSGARLLQSKSIRRTEKKSRLRCPRRTARPRISQNIAWVMSPVTMIIRRQARKPVLHGVAVEGMAQDPAEGTMVQLRQRQHVGRAGPDQLPLDIQRELGRQDHQRGDRVLPHQGTEGRRRRDAVVAIEHEDSAIEIRNVLGRRGAVGRGYELDGRARAVVAGLADQIDGRRRSRNQHDR